MDKVYSNNGMKKQIDYDWIKKEFFQIYDKEMLEEYCKKAIQTYKELEGKINIFHKRVRNIKKENVETDISLWGMYLRIVLSLLIDGDWTDTACFFSKMFRYQKNFIGKRRRRFGMDV